MMGHDGHLTTSVALPGSNGDSNHSMEKAEWRNALQLIWMKDQGDWRRGRGLTRHSFGYRRLLTEENSRPALYLAGYRGVWVLSAVTADRQPLSLKLTGGRCTNTRSATAAGMTQMLLWELDGIQADVCIINILTARSMTTSCA